jgi:hypothetical protein
MCILTTTIVCGYKVSVPELFSPFIARALPLPSASCFADMGKRAAPKKAAPMKAAPKAAPKAKQVAKAAKELLACLVVVHALKHKPVVVEPHSCVCLWL